jgi:polysaccharide biosynthesis transport protein
MSRNFELLTQLESEPDVRDKRHVSQAAREAVKALTVPTSSDTGPDEMLQFVQRVFLSANGTAPHAVVFCGVDAEGGSSTVCARAGLALAANTSELVCLLDANVRSPRLSRLFAIDSTFRTVASSGSIREKCTLIKDNLWLAGVEALGSNRDALPPVDHLKQLLAQLRGAFEYVLIDAPGTNVCGDAPLLGQAADAALLVINANSTRRVTARKAKDTLLGAGVRLLGSVLCDRSFPIPASIYRKL